MNYLAHVYLSFNNPDIQIGNFIADSVKGKNHTNFPLKIQQGILLHRKIDSYTDSHPIIKNCKRVFKDYRHYSGVILDIVLDHFLAKNWNTLHSTPLPKFTTDFYQLLHANFDILPKRVQGFYPIMQKYNWLLMYESIPGISNILYQMNVRTGNVSQMNYATIELKENYAFLEEQFFLFFEELIAFAKKELEQILSN